MSDHFTFDEYELYEFPKRYVFLPRERSARAVGTPTRLYSDVLVLDRVTGQFKQLDMTGKEGSMFNGADSMTRVFGIVGVIELVGQRHLIVIVRREYVGSIFGGHHVYGLREIKFLPIDPLQPPSRSGISSPEDSKRRDDAYLLMADKVFTEHDSFYFSYTTNLCVDFQDSNTKNRAPHAARHFFWNRHLSSALSKSGLSRYVLPMIRGLIIIEKTVVADSEMTFGLVCRTSNMRAGTRYNCRGADERGNVANYCEVEHFIDCNGVFSSFRQIRGSIPFQWTQFAENLKYTPEIKFDNNVRQHTAVIEQHFQDVFKSYPGPVVAINLCKKKEESQERKLSDMFERLANYSQFPQPYVKYIHFDLHHECKGLDFSKLDDLIDSLQPQFDEIGYFSIQHKPDPSATRESKILSLGDDSPSDYSFQPKVLRRQEGIFRVNCVDCCDRTNVAKTYVSRRVFLQMMFDMNITKRRGNSLLAYPQLEKLFNHMWSENGDRISSLYTGTGALMGDYTRTGQRSVRGLMNDGLNSVTRYVKNNFADEIRQRGIHLVLGKLDLHGTEEQRAFAKANDLLSDVFGANSASSPPNNSSYAHHSTY